MAEPAKPKKLYRFFSREASDLFASRKLWFSAAKDFNDLFEVLPRYDSLLSKEIEDATKKGYAFLPPHIAVDWPTYKKHISQFNKQLYQESIETIPAGFQEKFSQHFGIVCFSENLTSLLMWGHYASCHQGFVVEFEPNHILFPAEEFGRVSYSQTRPCVETKEHWTILLTKSPEWSYEAEHRLIKPLVSLQRCKRRDGAEKPCLDLPPDSVSAVYIGCRMPETNRNEILDALKAPEWKHVGRFAMRRHETDYAVMPIRWEELKPVPQDAVQDFYSLWQAIGL